MLKQIAIFVISLLAGLLIVEWITAEEIVLTTPIPQNVITMVRVSNISDHPNSKQLSFRLSIGYINTDGVWIEVKDDHVLIENTPAVPDNPATPENEAKPANPKYDNLQILMKTSGKSAERIILERVNSKYAGSIQ